MIRTPSLDVAPRIEELVARACERAGLDDFGSDSWREGLTLLVQTVESSPGVNAGGRDYVYSQFVDALWNRLRIVDYLKHHPEVSDEWIERPLVVLGLPRTGYISRELSARPGSTASFAVDLGSGELGTAGITRSLEDRSTLPQEESRT